LPRLRPEDIGVMAPWRAQVWKIREKLRENSLSGVDVGSVEVFIQSSLLSLLDFLTMCVTRSQDFQGRECRIVIISCVRSQSRFLEEDMEKGLGLLFEPKRYLCLKY
jgi:superfamily I DNA and/or RNA helicase